MAKKEIKKPSKVKVRALMQLARIGYSYAEGSEFELDAKIANELIKDGYIEKCGK